MFIRLKKINGLLYAYKVKNSWTGKGARQHSVKYLGKALVLPTAKALPFSEFLSQNKKAGFLDSADLQDILAALLSWELHRRGITETAEGFLCGDARLSLRKLVPVCNGKPVILKLDSGYWCEESIAKLLGFRKRDNEDHEQAGTRLANCFFQVGIAVPKDVFVKVYEKTSYFDEPAVETSLKNFE